MTADARRVCMSEERWINPKTHHFVPHTHDGGTYAPDSKYLLTTDFVFALGRDLSKRIGGTVNPWIDNSGIYSV